MTDARREAVKAKCAGCWHELQEHMMPNPSSQQPCQAIGCDCEDYRQPEDYEVDAYLAGAAHEREHGEAAKALAEVRKKWDYFNYIRRESEAPTDHQKAWRELNDAILDRHKEADHV